MTKILPMLISMTIIQFIYFKIDNKYDMTNKISLKIPIKQELKPLLFTCCMFLGIIIIGLIGIYIIDINYTLYGVISGILVGFCNGISYKLSKSI